MIWSLEAETAHRDHHRIDRIGAIGKEGLDRADPVAIRAAPAFGHPLVLVQQPRADWAERAITWETLTATTLLHAGADVVVLRHPESVKEIKAVIARLMAGRNGN